MAKKKGKTSKSSRRAQKPFAFKTTGKNLVDYVSAQVNPFDPLAAGSKIHDANASNTFTYTSREIHTITTNTNGMGYYLFYPNINTSRRVLDTSVATKLPTSGVLSSATYANYNIDTYTSIAALTARYRIVSWGIRLQSMQNALDAQGRVLVREMSTELATTGGDTFAISDRYVNIAHTHDMDYTIIPAHVGENYQTFIAPSLTYGTQVSDAQDDPGYKGIAVTLAGFKDNGAGAIALQAEIVYNLEIIPLIDTIGVHLADEAAPHSTAVLEAVHNSRSKLELVHHSKSFLSKVKDASRQAFNALGHYALDRLTGGLEGVLAKRLSPTQRPGLFPMITNG